MLAPTVAVVMWSAGVLGTICGGVSHAFERSSWVYMITKEQVMPLLLEACPSFAERWKEYQADSAEDELLYMDLSEFASHIVGLYKDNRTQEFAAVFAIVEQLHLEGDQYVKEAAAIGLLEGIQNIAGHRAVDPEVFVEYLGPESAKWWNRLNDFWN